MPRSLISEDGKTEVDSLSLQLQFPGALHGVEGSSSCAVPREATEWLYLLTVNLPWVLGLGGTV